MIRFSLFGVPVEIQPFFWVTTAMLGGALRADSREAFLAVALFMIAAFVSILVHELGHALTIKAFGLPTAVTLQAFGGFATYPSGILNRKKSFLVSAAGPAIQLLLAAITFLISQYVPAIYTNENADYFFFTIFGISAFWAIINLLPVLPLDGGQILNAILGPRRIRITLWTTIFTSVIAAILMFQLLGSFLFPIFLASFGFQAFKALKESGNRWH
jgi:stage IV sporulation protein FB